MNGNSTPFRSILANNIPPTAWLACCISETSSDATALCFINGCAVGLSSTGSNGSRGLIRWARIQILGSDTSNTLSGPFLSVSLGEGSCGYIYIHGWINRWIFTCAVHTHRYTLGQESIDALHGDDEAVSVHRGQGDWLRPCDSVLPSHTSVLVVMATTAVGTAIRSPTTASESDWWCWGRAGEERVMPSQ